VRSRSTRQALPDPPQPAVERQTNVSFRSTWASRNRPSSSGAAPRSASRASSAIPHAPTVPGFGGTITSAPVCRATAAASASALKGIPWQNTTSPTERLPFTRFR
jgi:hypothetical protein